MKNIIDKDRKNIWHPFTPLSGADDPLVIDSAEGVFLITNDGRKIIDAVSSWWVNLHGHANPYIADALAAQARKLEHVIFAGFTHEPAVKLSENLLKVLPGNQSRMFFSDNGSTAVEVALKMAIQYWNNQKIKKKKIIAIHGAYHGDTFGSMSVGDRGVFTDPFSPYLFETSFIDFPQKNNEHQVFEQFKTLVDKDDVGVFIFEPLVQGASGMRIYNPQVLDKMIGYAQEKKVICIADEVFTGFGRTGKFFASDYLVNKPDVIALSKGLTGGTMALGVTACCEEIVSVFKSDDFLKTFFHGHSFTANPLACAAANASFELLMQEKCWQRIGEISRMQNAFREKIENHRNVIAAKNLGTILAIELKTASVSSYTNEEREKIYRYFLERDILLRPLGNIIYVLPPYVITDEDLGRVHASIEEFLNAEK